MQNRLLREPEVRSTFGLGAASSTYDLVYSGLLTPPVRAGKRSVGWPLNEIDALYAERVRGAALSEIKALVQRLVKARAHVRSADNASRTQWP